MDLATLEMIGNETVKDAVKATMFKRELMQASAALGAGGLKNEDDNNEGN